MFGFGKKVPVLRDDKYYDQLKTRMKADFLRQVGHSGAYAEVTPGLRALDKYIEMLQRSVAPKSC